MRIVTFYSFKGGVGRTTAMLNVAYLLAQRGRKVVVADWDLHAPGLSLMERMQPLNGDGFGKGVLDYLLGLKESKNPKKAQKRVVIADIVHSTHLAREAQRRKGDDLEEPRMQGELFCIPAGNLAGGLKKFTDAVKNANLHNLTNFLSYIDPEDKRLVFRVFCEELRQTSIPWLMARSEGPADYLLVDCRTGITELGDLLLGEATDLNVVVYGQDPQNLEGLKIALSKFDRQPWELAANTLLIWSLEPAGQEVLKRKQRELKRAMVNELCRKDGLGVPEAFPTEYKIPYHPELPLTNVPIVHTYAQSDLSRVFADITQSIEEKCFWDDFLVSEYAKIDIVKNKMEGDHAAQRMREILADQSWRGYLLKHAYTHLDLAHELGLEWIRKPWSWEVFWDGNPFERVPLLKKFGTGDRKTLINRMVYATSFTVQHKKVLLEQLAKEPDHAKERKLAESFAEERTHDLTQSMLTAWWTSVEFLGAMLDWWCMVLSYQEQTDVNTRVIVEMLEGKGVPNWPDSEKPIFNLLLAVLLSQDLTKNGDAFKKWMREHDWPLQPTAYILAQNYLTRSDAPSRLIQDHAWFVAGFSALMHAKDLFGEQKCEWLAKAITACEYCPDDADTLTNLGVALADMGRIAPQEAKAEYFQKAIRAYEQSFIIRPDDAGTLTNLGNVLVDMGRIAPQEAKAEYFQKAIRVYEQSLIIRPDDAGTLTNLGNVLVDMGRIAPQEAKAEYFQKAMRACEQSLIIRTDDANTLTNFGGALFNMGRIAPQEAKAEY
ncbi:MAG: AAA family ATPase, partial [Magnetococcus sp. YQC-5]